MNLYPKVEKLYYTGIGIGLLLGTSMILRNLHNVDPFAARPHSIFLYLYLAIIVIGAYSVYSLTKYYYELGSIDFLIMGFIVYNLTVVFFYNQTFTDFFSTQWIYFNFKDYEPENLTMVNMVITLGMTGFFAYAIRAYGWNNFSKPEKGILGFVLYTRFIVFLIILADQYVRNTGNPITVDPKYFFLFYLLSNIPLFSTFAPFYLRFSDYLLWSSCIYIYAKIKPGGPSDSIQTTKMLWITVSVIYLLITTANGFLGIVGWSSLLYNIWATGTFLVTVILAITVIYYPESLLISTKQLFRAKKLYNYLEENVLPENPTQYQMRIADYINNLPEEIKAKIDVA